MIEIPVHNMEGEKVDSLQVDEQVLGGQVRPVLLKQAYVRYHANARQGSAHTRKRSEVRGSTRKLFRQKGTGNARRGSSRSNIMRGGGHGHSKKPHSWRLGMPRKMRRLANRNALLAKAIDNEIKLLDQFSFERPSTQQFSQLLAKLDVHRSCLIAVVDTQDHTAHSMANLAQVNLTRIDQLNTFDLLNHRYLVAQKDDLAQWLDCSGEKEDG